MQKLVNEVYKAKQIDKLKKVSRFEFEQRDIRNKLDTADIYMKLEKITEALEKQGIAVAEIDHAEEQMVEMVIEDRQRFAIDLMEFEYKRRQEALNKGSLVEKARKLIFGAAVSPEEALANSEIKVTVEPDKENAEKISKVLNMVSKLIPHSEVEHEEPAVEPKVAAFMDKKEDAKELEPQTPTLMQVPATDI